MATLVRRFRDVPFVADAIGTWNEADGRIGGPRGLASGHGLPGSLLPENIELITDMAEESSAVQAPPAHLEQILLNLVINAPPRAGDSSAVVVDERHDAERALVPGDVEEADLHPV